MTSGSREVPHLIHDGAKALRKLMDIAKRKCSCSRSLWGKTVLATTCGCERVQPIVPANERVSLGTIDLLRELHGVHSEAIGIKNFDHVQNSLLFIGMAIGRSEPPSQGSNQLPCEHSEDSSRDSARLIPLMGELRSLGVSVDLLHLRTQPLLARIEWPNGEIRHRHPMRRCLHRVQPLFEFQQRAVR